MAEFYTTQELAHMLNVSHTTAKRMCLMGAVKANKVGHAYQIPKTSVAQCRVCGKWFVVCKDNRTLCSDECRKQRNRDFAKAAYYAKKQTEQVEPITAEECEQMCLELPFDPEPAPVPDYMAAFVKLVSDFAASAAELARKMGA